MTFMNKLFSNAYTSSVIKKCNVIVFGILSTALLNRYLGPGNKGEYAYILSVVNILVVVFNMGITLSYPNFKRRKDRDYLPIFLSLMLVEFVFLSILTMFIGFFIHSIRLFFVFLMTTMSVFRLQLNYINLIENIKYHSIITTVSAIGNAALFLVVFLVTDTDILYAYLIYLAKDMVIIVFSLCHLRVKFNKIKGDFVIWKDIIKFGLIPMYTTLLISINYKVDVILLKFLNINLIEIGLYTVGVSLAEYGWLIPDIFKDVMINKTAKKDDIDNMTFSLRISSTMMILVFAFIIVGGKHMLMILFGSAFIGAYSVTVIIFIGIYSMIYCKIIGTLYIAKGQWAFYSKILTLSVVANVGMNLLLIPKWGIYGAAASSILSYSIAGLAFLIDFKRAYNIRAVDLIFISKVDVTKVIKMVTKLRR